MLDYFFQLPFLLLAVIISAVLLLGRKKKEYATLPPGPPSLPIVGNTFQIKHTNEAGKKRLRSIAELVNKYGKNGMATLYFGKKPFVFVTDFETIKRILNDDVLTGRPLLARDAFFERKGLIGTEGDLWREQRRFGLSTLRDFGMGKSWLQDLVIEEAQELVDDLKKTNGKPVFPERYLTPCVCNVICAISFGERFNHQDEKFIRISSLVSANMKIHAKNQLIDFFPFLRYIPFSKFRTLFLMWLKNCTDLTEFLQIIVKQRESTLYDGEPRDYIHAFMLQAEKQKADKDSSFTGKQLERSIFDLFGAGTDTTATTLTWAVLHLMENPDVYQKVQEEVDRVIRDGSFPNMDDKEQLPYTQATIFEAQRLANLVPIAARRTMEETTLNGFTIPAGVNVFPMLSAVHEDPKYFPDPLVFRPERFLDESGVFLSKVDGFAPFSIGKRFCLGQSLAQMELYIFFVTLIKYFRIRLIPSDQKISSDDSIFGIVNSPYPFTVTFESR